MNLTTFLFFLYVAISVVIGWITSRNNNEERYMIAERNLSGWQLSATMSAGFFDGAILAIYFAYVYKYGFNAIWLFVGLFLGFLFFAHSRVKSWYGPKN